MKESILEFSFNELKDGLVKNGFKAFRAYQLMGWIYKKFVFDFSKMTDISNREREILAERYSIISLEQIDYVMDAETVKFLFKTSDGNYIESVIIFAPSERDKDERVTLCVSTQIGCALKCDFCATGQLEFKRNLTVSEILSQVLLAEEFLKSRFATRGNSTRNIGNIVFMGMGEPLLNVDNVLKAIYILTFSGGYNIGARHITISTVGIIEGIERLANIPLQVRLAVSLHSPFQHKREKLIPIARKYKLEDLIGALENYQRSTKRRITFEYILIDDFNVSDEEAIELSGLLRNLEYNLNLIEYNPVKNRYYRSPSEDKIKLFTDRLKDLNIPFVIRRRKGEGVFAGCGQLGLYWKNTSFQ
jgi:23S rRNA (adenine2503-C2)-methyltransferase